VQDMTERDLKRMREDDDLLQNDAEKLSDESESKQFGVPYKVKNWLLLCEEDGMRTA